MSKFSEMTPLERGRQAASSCPELMGVIADQLLKDSVFLEELDPEDRRFFEGVRGQVPVEDLEESN